MPGELLLDDLVARCEGAGAIDVGEGVLVDVGEACTALAAWDARFDLDSVGAVVFREWVGDFESSEQLDEGSMFAVGFDPADPVGTPNTLATTQTTGGEDRQLFALAKAVQRLNEAGVAIDAPLRDAQFTKKGDITIPIHGGTNADGVTNIVDYGVFKTTLDASMSRGDVVNGATGLTTEGYVINRGTSFIMSLAFTEDGPKAKAFLTYSQGSSKPGDPTFDDQTQLFSEKAWRDCLFTEEEITADPELRSYDVSAPRPVADEPAAQD
jgi:acyl-homoserine-lactone acylase